MNPTDAAPLSCLACRERAAHVRGVCDRCLSRHQKAVSRGQVTWADLEARGLILAAQPVGQGWRKNWTVRGTGE
jgi:hypothetical protein